MFRRLVLLGLLLVAAATPLLAKDEWLPVSKEDLALKDNPAQPGAAAMILHREVFTDNAYYWESNYTRIKIFTDEGKKYADVEIPYVNGLLGIRDLKARTIQPDGSVVVFAGKPYDKLVVKSKWVKVQTKAFTLPEVRAGSIIEYKYTYSFENQLFAPTWEVQDTLAIRHLKYVLNPYPKLAVRWASVLLPKGVTAKAQKDRTIMLEMDNVPALDKEDYTPPESTLKMRVEFFYTYTETLPEPAVFWKQEGKGWFATIEAFIGNHGAITREAAELAPPTDPPEARLKKLYARAQQIRNLTYEDQKTEKEQNREKLKDNSNVEDVLKHGYGYRSQINRFFVALARGAGFDASVVRISERDAYFFHESLLNPNQLDGEIALVRGVAGKDLYLDPATPFCPFGLLFWPRTGVRGILPAKDGGVFITVREPNSREALTERKAQLRVTPEGDLEGQLEVNFYGQEALRRRLEARTWDETARRKDLESDLKDWMPSGAVITIESTTGWQATDEPLHAAAILKLPGYAVATGRRLMVARGLFKNGIGQPFRSANRVHPIYFAFPWSEADEITIALPAGCAVESLAPPHDQQAPFGTYHFSSDAQGTTVRLHRSMSMDGILFRIQFYPALKGFFDTLRAADEEQLVIHRGDSGSGQ